LVLSEFAGAAQALGAGCVRVNPYDTRELARGFHLALSMPAEQRGVLHEYADQV
jgi:trehalose 6-phosphate synthase/phosphatase